jgi:hypothetical protein
MRLQRPHGADLLQRQGEDHDPGHDGQEDDREPPARVDVVVEERQQRVGDVLERLQEACQGEDQAGIPPFARNSARASTGS